MSSQESSNVGPFTPPDPFVAYGDPKKLGSEGSAVSKHSEVPIIPPPRTPPLVVPVVRKALTQTNVSSTPNAPNTLLAHKVSQQSTLSPTLPTPPAGTPEPKSGIEDRESWGQELYNKVADYYFNEVRSGPIIKFANIHIEGNEIANFRRYNNATEAKAAINSRPSPDAVIWKDPHNPNSYCVWEQGSPGERFKTYSAEDFIGYLETKRRGFLLLTTTPRENCPTFQYLAHRLFYKKITRPFWGIRESYEDPDVIGTQDKTLRCNSEDEVNAILSDPAKFKFPSTIILQQSNGKDYAVWKYSDVSAEPSKEIINDKEFVEFFLRMQEQIEKEAALEMFNRLPGNIRNDKRSFKELQTFMESGEPDLPDFMVHHSTTNPDNYYLVFNWTFDRPRSFLRPSFDDRRTDRRMRV